MFTVCTTPPPVKKLGAVQRLKPAKSNIYARRVAGLFFCLASAEGAGLLFCSATIQPHTIVYSAFCTVHASYTANDVKRHTGLYRRFSRDLPHSTAYNTRPTQAAIIPPAPRRGATQVSTAAYYNKVYKGAAVRPCYGYMPDSAAYHRPCKPGGVCVSTCTGSARRLAIWHPPLGGAVQQQGHGGRRGTIDGYRRISFRAFAR